MRDRLHTQSQRLAEVTNELERAKKTMATSPEQRYASKNLFTFIFFLSDFISFILISFLFIIYNIIVIFVVMFIINSLFVIFVIA